MKRLISLVLIMAISLTLFCIPASAEADYSVTIFRFYGSGYTNVTFSYADGDVYYTTDGSKPTTKSTKYTGKFKVSKPVTLRIAVYDGNTAVKRYKTSISVRVATPTASVGGTSDGKYLYNIKTTSGATVYYTTDGTTPSKSNGEKAKNGQISVAPGSTLRIIAYKSGWSASRVYRVNVPTAVPGTTTEEEFVSKVIALVNQERSKEGLIPLSTIPNLTKAANKRAEELITAYGHTRPDGSRCFTVLAEYDLTYMAAGENVAAGQRTPEAVVDAWMNSDGHRKNILNEDFRYIGVGCTFSETGYGIYWAQLFIK